MGEARYAIYYVPPRDSDLWAFGCAWLGRDPETGENLPQDDTPELPLRELAEVTAAPRRYGFHATLRAPFALAAGTDEAGLLEAVAGFAAARAAFDAPPVDLYVLGGFLALTLSEGCPAMDALAAAAVEAFEPFRAPLTEGEIARRRRARLTPRQDAQLLRWGYPYVFEDFVFHMTLTDKLDDEEEREILRDALKDVVSVLGSAPLPVREVGLFKQPNRETPFRLIRRFPLAG
jgi:putative phosphonate metabolism protein